TIHLPAGLRIEIGAGDAVHHRPMVQARVSELPRAVVAGWRKAEHADIPMEVAGIPADDERREGRVAEGKIGVAGPEVERPEGPQAERAGELRDADADIDVHGDD